jgi:hypothetical protein
VTVLDELRLSSFDEVESEKVITLVENNEKLSAAPLRRRAELTGPRLILLGMLIGGTCTLLSSAMFLGGLGIMSPLPYLLVTIVLGSFVGAFVTILASKFDEARWIALVVAALVGLAIPICLIQMLFLLAGLSGDL